MKITSNYNTNFGRLGQPQPFIRRVQIFFIQRAKNNSDLYFAQTNPGVDVDLVEHIIRKKETALPWSMLPFFNASLSYVKGNADVHSTARAFFQNLSKFYRRINIAQDAQRFCKNYPDEISTIKNIAGAFGRFSRAESTKRELDSRIALELFSYAQKPANYGHYYMY